MRKYLDTWRSALPTNQATAILTVLEEEQASGKLMSKSEFTTRLNQLVMQSKVGPPSPLLNVYQALYRTLVDTESFNRMLLLADGDLKALFAENDNIGQLLESQRILFSQFFIPGVDNILNDVERAMAVYQLLEGDTNGFSAVQYNNFRDKNFRTGRTVPNSVALFTDNVTGILTTEEYDGTIREVQGVLTLPVEASADKPANFSTSRIVEAESNVPDYPVSTIAENGIENILDERSEFFWEYGMPYKSQQDYVEVTVEVSVSGVTSINYIDIHPIQGLPIVIQSIQYADPSGETTDLDIAETELLEVEIDNPVRFTVLPTYVSRILVKLRQKNVENGTVAVDVSNRQPVIEIPPYNGTQGDNYDQHLDVPYRKAATIFGGETTHYIPAKGGQTSSGNWSKDEHYLETGDGHIAIPAAEEVVANLAGGELGAGDHQSTVDVPVYMYKFGLGYLGAGDTEYKSRCIYVSPEEEVSRLGLLGLSVDSYVPDSEVPGRVTAHLEYNIYKEDYDKYGQLIGSYIFPILPMSPTGVADVEADNYITWPIQQEVLYPDKDGYAELRFKAIGPGSDEDYLIEVFRNNERVTENIAWEVVSTNIDTQTRLHIIDYGDGGYLEQSAIYTVSYTPWYMYNTVVDGYDHIDEGSSPEVTKYYYDREMTLQVGVDNLVQHNIDKITTTAESSKVYAIITMRSTEGTIKNPPYLRDYKLLLGSVFNA